MVWPRNLNIVLSRSRTEHAEERVEYISRRLLQLVAHLVCLAADEVSTLVLIGHRDEQRLVIATLSGLCVLRG